jgi:hypothetical protein
VAFSTIFCALHREIPSSPDEREDARAHRSQDDQRQHSGGVRHRHRIQLEVIVIDLALRFPQDGLKVACRGQLGEPLQSHSWLGSCAKTQRSAAGFRAGK